VPAPLEKLVMVAAGQSVVISTQVAGALPFTYRWLRNGQPITGAAGSSSSTLVQFTTAAQTAADNGTRYAVEVNNADGASTSTTTTLTIVDVPRVAAGGAHSLALSADGRTLWAWGGNGQGQLGLGDTASRAAPAAVPGLPALQAIAAGADHSLALAADGSVWAWGSNRAGALGDGSLNGRALPQRVIGAGGVVAIAAGNGRSFALRADGSLLGWGENSSGALGLGNTVNMLVPAPVGRNIDGFDSIVAVAAGARHTLALRSDGQVLSFGEVAVPLADGVGMRSSPMLVAGLNAVAGIAAGDGFAVALDIGGRLWAWGRNGSGQLGLGSTAATAAPTLIGAWPSTGLAAGDDFVLALPVSGALQAWGAADDGQLGSGTASAPQLRPGTLSPLPATLRSIVAGGSHALAVLADGSVHTWGANGAGQLGIASSEPRRTEPVQVPGLNLN
jgi:alpha-tubulin suppressor-like RCC1 family protein